MDAYWEMVRAHRIIELYGGVRRERIFAQPQAGIHILFYTSFDGERLRISDSKPLPPRLAGPLDQLIFVRDMWLNKLESEGHRRRHNIVMGIEVGERLMRAMASKALVCSGSRYTVQYAVSLIIGAIQNIANLPVLAEGTHLHVIMADTGIRINDLLRAAGCAESALPMAA